MQHEALTAKILEAAFVVSNELGAGFLESVYANSLLIALHSRGLETKHQAPLEVKFQGHIVGDFFADLLVDDTVILELKAVREVAPSMRPSC